MGHLSEYKYFSESSGLRLIVWNLESCLDPSRKAFRVVIYSLIELYRSAGNSPTWRYNLLHTMVVCHDIFTARTCGPGQNGVGCTTCKEFLLLWYPACRKWLALLFRPACWETSVVDTSARSTDCVTALSCTACTPIPMHKNNDAL